MITPKYLIFIAILLGALILACFSSCSPEWRMAQLNFKEPQIVAENCAKLYPVTIKPPIIIRTSDTTTNIIYPNCDSILEANPGLSRDELIQLLKGYTVKTQTVNHYETKTVQVRDSAMFSALNLKIDQLIKDGIESDKKAAIVKGGRNVWMYVAIGLCILLVALLYFVIRSIISTKSLKNIIK